TPTSWIEDGVFSFENAECVNDINDAFIGVELAELVPFFRTNEFLENPAKNVSRNLFEVEPFDRANRPIPCFERVDSTQSQQSRPLIVPVWEKHRLVIASLFDGFIKAFA